MHSRILILILLGFAAGCISVDVCDETYDSELVARFKTWQEEVTADTMVSVFSLYGIREGLPDSLLYDSIPASGFTVPLDPHRQSSSFVLQINENTDTLVVSYGHEVYLISYSCGFANLFMLDNIETRSGIIQSDTILNTMIDAEYESNEVHIWLYL